MAPDWHLPASHTPYFSLSFHAFFLVSFLPDYSVLELERASGTRKLNPCVQMRLQRPVICPKTSRLVTEHTQGLYQQRAGPPPVFAAGCHLSCSPCSAFSSLLEVTTQARLTSASQRAEHHFLLDPLRPWSSLILPSSQLCIPTSLRAHLAHCSPVSGMTLFPFTPWVLQKSSHAV